MLECNEVWEIVAAFPNLSKLWDYGYVSKDCQKGFQQPWLNRLAEKPDEEIRTELRKLDGYLGAISTYLGFQKLRSGLRARAIEQFASTLAEVKTAAWISTSHTLAEIRPLLPSSTREADFRLAVDGKTVYGEVSQPRELPSSWIAGSIVPIALTDQPTEEPKRIGALREKGNAQLPPNVIGIWVAHVYHTALQVAWADFFRKDMANRPNLLGVAIWTRLASRLALEGTRLKGLVGDDHEVYWVQNDNATHQSLRQQLLQLL